MSGSAFCKIVGNKKVEELKRRLGYIQLNIESLKRSNQALQRILEEIRKPEHLQDAKIFAAFTLYAVVEYTKCFNSDFGDKLAPAIFSNHLPDNAPADDLSEREFHNLIMNYRNQHLAHTGQILKITEVMGSQLANGEIGVGCVAISRTYQEDFSFYNGLNLLVQTAARESDTRAAKAQQKLIDLIKSGEANISTEPVELVPIPENIGAREMWGLPMRKSKPESGD